MTTLVAGTHFISPDEKAWVLVELNQMRPDGRGVHRYQLTYVNRGDVIAEHRVDLGAASGFSAPEFRIPSLLEHTVGELWDIAEFQRLGQDFWQKRAGEIAAESTLIPDTVNWLEERQRIVENRSVFGPGGQKQRNGFSTDGLRDYLRRRVLA